jgi:mRNA interferase MazF
VRQGEIWEANLNPAKGSEQAGFRPVVIISGNLLNENLSIVIVIPLTSRIKRYKGNPVLIPDEQNGLKKESEMLVFHIRSISKDRLVKKTGTITSEQLSGTMRTLGDILKY